MKRLNNETGSALVVVLVLIVLAAGSLTYLLHSSSFGLRLAKNQVARNTLELASESGINLAKADLYERSQALDFQFPGGSNPIADRTESAKRGLWISEASPVSMPRIQYTANGIRTSVWYFPNENNPGDPERPSDTAHNDEFPKTFEVVSEAMDLKTGEIHSMESMFLLRYMSFAEVSFGVLSPDLPPDFATGNKMVFFPSINDGRVHFPDANINLFSGDHTFKGPVTFDGGNLPGNSHPFSFNQGESSLEFDMGYKTRYGLKFNKDIFQKVVDQATIDLSSYGEVCLRFEGAATKVYRAAPTQFDPKLRCVGESSNSPLATVPTGGIIYSSSPIHVKGLYSGQVTVASHDIVLEGDLVKVDQSVNSKDRLGIVAENNIIVPRSVPNGTSMNYPFKVTASPYWKSLNNVTNFIARDSLGQVVDRDLSKEQATDKNGNPTCAHYAYAYGNNDCDNSTGTLDIDAAMLAVNGEFHIDGISDYDLNPASGMTIPAYDVNGAVQFYTTETGKPNSYYFQDSNGVWQRKGEPVFCLEYPTANTPGICNPGQELPRPYGEDIWLYGSLVTNKFSKIGNEYRDMNRIGFKRKVTTFDPTFLHTPPPGFPFTQNVVFDVLWTKSYHGKSPRTS